MSFILDALKKSESDRQQSSGAEFTGVPSRPGEDHPYKWLWILALLLAVNFAALLIVLLRPGAEPETAGQAGATPAEESAAATPTPADSSFEQQLARAREAHEQREQTAATSDEPVPGEPPAPVSSSARPPVPSQNVRTIDELRLDGALQLEELHLDIHVYSDEPAERFVFINMVKHREGSQLSEGPTVNAITPEGVILDHQGTTFLLPRR